MKVLVVGPYPPAPGPAAADAVAEVVELVEAGETVEVLAPQPGAAHHDARLRGVMGALALARRSRGFDQVVLRATPGVLLRPQSNRVQWLKDATVLARVLQRGPETVMVLDDLRWFPIGGRASRELWSAVSRFIVRSEQDAAKLADEGGVPRDRIDVRPSRRVRRLTDNAGWGVDGTVGYAEAMTQIRLRAVADRELAEAAAAPIVDTSLPPEQSAPVVMAKQLFRRVLGAYADPVIAAVRRRIPS